MLLRETVAGVLAAPAVAGAPVPEVPRRLLRSLRRPAGHALVLTGMRRCGKRTLQQQLRGRERGAAVFCNLEDTRLYGLGSEDFPTLHSVLDEHRPGAAVYLDEVQDVPEWYVSLLIRANSTIVLGFPLSRSGVQDGRTLPNRPGRRGLGGRGATRDPLGGYAAGLQCSAGRFPLAAQSRR